jgi:hypothetical protein
MSRLWSLITVTALILMLSIEAAAAGQEAGQIAGRASADGVPVRNATARLRDIESGQLVATTTSDNLGIFAFVTVPPGNYVVELACGGGALLGASAPITLVAGAMTAHGVTVDVNAPAARAAAGAGTCLSSRPSGLVDLVRRPFRNPLGVAVVTAAAASGVAAIVTTKDDTSASR